MQTHESMGTVRIQTTAPIVNFSLHYSIESHQGNIISTILYIIFFSLIYQLDTPLFLEPRSINTREPKGM